MKKISKIRELALIISVLVLMNGIVSYAKSETVVLYADQASATSDSVEVTDGVCSAWGSVSSGSKHDVRFIVPDSIRRNAFDSTYAPGQSFPATEGILYYVSSTYITLKANPNGSPKKECIASAGIAD